MQKYQIFLAAGLASALLIQAAPAQQGRITEAVDNSRRAVLQGHVNPRLRSATDLGPVDVSQVLPYVTLVLKPSAGQQAALLQLLDQQQDASSANYHRWLTPEQYASQFGVNQSDIGKIVSWLGAQGLVVRNLARGRNAISFSGTAGQIENAFAIEMHHYLVNAEPHFANDTEPSIPAAFQAVVSAIHGLTDFRLKPASRHSVHPHDTIGPGEHQLAPGDVAAIYDIAPLYKAGISGAGQKLAVAGQTRINLADIERFRGYFTLPANDPQTLLVPNTQDPGISKADLGEADLDLELSGAVAPAASITFVYSADVMDAVQYAIDQNLAPVLSLSYGDCEQQTGSADLSAMQTWARQGNSQGITWFAASGDSGAADCYGGTDPATNSTISVDAPASIPEVTGVGGTEFSEGGGNYWSAINTASHASALSYIPETVWNDSAFDGVPSASGGGASTVFTKPFWQAGTGVPSDGFRDVPDVSISASADHDGYVTYSGGVQQIVGGTSAGPPQFAGIAVLLNQYLVANNYQSTPGLGNMNPRLYALQHTTGVFHDITSGNNIVNPCEGVRHCTAVTPIGFEAGVGYDLATGLGTVDVFSLITAWHESGSISPAAVSMSLSASVSSLPFAGSTILTATVKSTNGGTPDGTVTFLLNGEILGSVSLAGSGAGAAAALTVYGIQLASGANAISAQYAGSTAYESATASLVIAITSLAPGPPSVKSVANAASFAQAFAPGGILSVYGTELAPATAGALAVPLPSQLAGVSATINGITAPLYYVSPGQLNIQIPFEVVANETAVLKVVNNGQSASFSFPVAAAAPGIFTFQAGAPVPYTSGARGQEIVLYYTGAGAVSPTLATGAAPAAGTPLANLPAPQGNVTVTVGGVDAKIYFDAIPWALAGVEQINYQVPPTAPLGAQPVVVHVGAVASAAATLQVTQ